MKKIISVILMITVLLSVLATSINSYATNVNLNNYDTNFLFDNDNVYLFGKDGSNLYVKKYTINATSENIYSLDYEIVNYCIAKDKIYILCRSNVQNNRYFIYLINNGKVSLYFSFDNSEIKSNDIVADNNGYIYIHIPGKRVYIYDRSGKMVNKINNNYYCMLNINDECYAMKYYEIHRISNDGVISTAKTSVTTPTTRISDNYLYHGARGEVYYFNNSITKVLETDKYIAHKICETDDYIVIAQNNILSAYNKIDYSLAYTYELSYSPIAVGVNGNKLILVNNNYNSQVLSADTIFVQNNDETQTTNIDYYSLNEDYVVVEQGTTISKFKSILGENYKVIFKNRTYGNIGTNYKADITHKSNTNTYSFVVMGDVTGEGNINSRDTYAIIDDILSIEKLKGYYKIAGDINCDNEISNIDLVKIAKMTE